jgi:hypothetical protein
LSKKESKNLDLRNSQNNDLKEFKFDLSLTEENSSLEKDYQYSDVEEFILSDSNDSNDSIKDFFINPEVYIKKVNSQDLEKTPSISARAITDFLKINLINGQVIDLPCQYKGKEIILKLKKRETRDEYRLFINKFRVEIGYNLNDLLVFRYKSERLHLDILKESYNISQNPRYNYYNSKLGKNFHLLL